MIRVAVADDHGVVRDGLAGVIAAQPDMELVATAADGAEAVAVCRSAAPDVVLMDLEMPVLDGIEATRAILAEAPGTAVLVLTSFSDRRRITGALDAGAVGYLLKDASAEEVLRGIRIAAEGGSPLDPRAARSLLEAKSAPDPLAGISPREREVLALLARRDAEQADRAAARDQREDGEVAPDEHLPADRRHRPRPGHPLGRTAGAPGRPRLVGDATNVPLRLERRLRRLRRVTRLQAALGIDTRLLALLLGVGILSLVAARPVAAVANDGPGEVRAAGDCGSGAASELRLKRGHDGIELRFRVDHAVPASSGVSRSCTSAGSPGKAPPGRLARTARSR